MDIKIEIKTQNKRHYYDISLLVDKEEFIEWIVDLRKKWKIEKLFTPEQYADFDSHIMKVSNNNWSSFLADIEQIRTRFGRLPNFDRVIIYALAFTEIPDGLYNSCYLEEIIDSGDPELSDGSKNKYAIILTPNTTMDDIAGVLKEYQAKTKKGLAQKKDKKVMEEAVSKYEFEWGPSYTPPPRIIDNVIRDREWYWLKEQGHSYAQIWKTALQRGEAITRDGVIKAIQAYKQRIGAEI